MRTDAKLLFAELYRYESGIRENIKSAGKLKEELLKTEDGVYLSKIVNTIWDEVDLIEKQATKMQYLLERFLSSGDYPGQTIHVTPLEQIAKEE